MPARLHEVGISSEDDSRRFKASQCLGAHGMIKKKHPNETLPVRYCLYLFEGALSDKQWSEISEQIEQQLSAQVGQQSAARDGNSASLHRRR